MHTIIRPLAPRNRQTVAAPAAVECFRQPAYDSQERRAAMKLVVYVPGVDASGVEIEGDGADLTITARKPHVVRVNWHALNLESAQRDYQLRLRLGSGYDFSAMQAEIAHGVLTVTLPKRADAAPPARLRRVA
jgi:HSP20 family protein